MATLVATAGATNANSYCTAAEADTYFETRLHATTWSTTTTANKEIALMWATRLLDQQMVWVGSKTDDDQALRWPRKTTYDPDGDLLDDDTIPEFLKNGTAEYAFFLSSTDRTLDPDTAGLKKIKLGSLSMEVNANDRRPVMPPSVWEIIRWYGTRKKGAVTHRTLVRG